MTQITSSNSSEMAPRSHTDGRIIYTRKQNDAEDIFAFTGSSSDWVGGAGDQTRPQWAGGSVVYFSSERGGESWDVLVSSSPGSTLQPKMFGSLELLQIKSRWEMGCLWCGDP